MISGVYRSRFIRYLRDRGLLATMASAFGGYSATAGGRAGINRRPLADRRQKLEHLTFVIDCNLQRLGIDPRPRTLELWRDRGRTKAPAAYEASSSLWRLAKCALKAPSGCTFRVRLNRRATKPTLLPGYTNSYLQLAGAQRITVLWQSSCCVAPKEPGSSWRRDE